jgi:para-aminobenzoate synthetase/4-amino-4-deoxychorismate lyase
MSALPAGRAHAGSDLHMVTDFPGQGRRTFTHAREIIAAHDINAVVPALARVEDATRSGSWAAGFITYEAAPAFEPAMQVRGGGSLPLLLFGVFDAPQASAADSTQATDVALSPDIALSAAPEITWVEQTSEHAFRTAIGRIHGAIADGATYQVNYTNRLHGAISDMSALSAWYDELRRSQGAGWHAYIDTGSHAILSASPELFFERRGSRIVTRPMKGTRARGRWREEDADHARELQASAKDRAENLMIVDLLRNDLGKIAQTGSVSVPALFDLEKYRTVWQLTSRIEAVLQEDIGLVSIFRALFPCGSVTGAPKINTMKWIAALETAPREVYCGAIGVIEPGGDCTFSVPIRTVWVDRATGHAEYGTGAGITFDSVADAELGELRAKTAILHAAPPAFELLETLRLERGCVVRRAGHVERMRRSAEYFGYEFDSTAINQLLDDALAHARTSSIRSMRVRLLLSRDGGVRAEYSAPAPARYDGPDACRNVGEPLRTVLLADRPVDGRDPFLCHKTTNRAQYETRRAEMGVAFDVLLWNEHGDITEFTTGNVVLQIGNDLLTPARSAGLLAGVFRAELLEQGTIREARVKRSAIAECRRMWLINSLREWVEVTVPASPASDSAPAPASASASASAGQRA